MKMGFLDRIRYHRRDADEGQEAWTIERLAP